MNRISHVSSLSFRRLLVPLLLWCCFFVTGCGGVPIAEDVSQAQANEIVAVLNESGISSMASRQSGGKARYTVEVKRSYYSQAVSLLHEKGLPGERKPTFSEMIAPSGIIPNSREMDALKLDHALATEVEEMLQNHPGIASVRAIVRLNFLRDAQAPAVSVIAQERSSGSVSAETLTPLISRIIPGVQSDSVTVTIVPAPLSDEVATNEGVLNAKGKVLRVPLAPFLFFWKIPEDDYVQIALFLVGCLLVVGIVGAVLGYWYAYYQHSKQYFDTTLPEVVPRSQRYERPRKEVRSIDEGEGPGQAS